MTVHNHYSQLWQISEGQLPNSVAAHHLSPITVIMSAKRPHIASDESIGRCPPT